MFHRRFASRLARGLAVSAVAVFAGAVTPAAAQTAPVVVELYTSQGCSSCPDADTYLGELVKQPGVLALGFHVDYWNYLGWRDPYSNKKFTYRQKEYAMTFRQTGVYTPQMVVQGLRGEVGSDRRAVSRAIAAARARKPLAAVALEKSGASGLRAVVTAEDGAKGAEIWLAVFDRKRSTSVPRGENEGKTLTNYNIVRVWRKVGDIAGEKTEVTLTLPAADSASARSGAAIVVQQPHCGPIVGAAQISLD
ncbi:MAG: DUF1223 domain-containing protein [Rhodospirillaceae bacterium]|nr:DUF1223 domain-containing protein [Rhodospirillaceae bacterium]